jgi:glycosyltransferase involved in cell wall biosynthesis
MDFAFPSVSLLVLVYNQRDLLDLAVASAFAQDCPPIEIVLSDDGSSDGSFARLQELAAGYVGPHRVIARQNLPNVGIGEHYNVLMGVASGELFVTAAGDDISTPDRVRRLVAAWDATGRRADLISSHLIDLDHQGNLHDIIRVDDLARWSGVEDWAVSRPYIVGASHAFTRRLMAHFGPMLKTIAYEDQIMTFRAICLGGGVIVDAPLVHYRRGGTSRLPTFDNTADMEHWTLRQSNRLMAERQQLIADADLAGCGHRVRVVLEGPMRRDRFMRAMFAKPSLAACLQAVREADILPLGWRLRKALHAIFPNATRYTKSVLQLFHRRYWRARRAAREAAQDKGSTP